MLKYLGSSDTTKKLTGQQIAWNNARARHYYEQASRDSIARTPQSQKSIPASAGIGNRPSVQAIQRQSQGRDGSKILSPTKLPAPSESFVVLSASQVDKEDIKSQDQKADKANANANATTTPTPSSPAARSDPNSLSHRLKHASRLFDVLSGKTNIDHPMCQECADMFQETINKHLSDATRERDAYVEFLKQRQAEEAELGDDLPAILAKMEKEIDDMKLEEQKAIQELQQAELEQKELEKELARLDEEAKQLDKEETEFWQDYNTSQREMAQIKQERDSVRLKYEHDVKELERLQKTNVYNDTFCIGHEGYFGTINGLRLGRMPQYPVDWSEINAAWGQTLLLLHTVATKLNFTFKGYRLIPMGSFSKIEKTDGDKGIYELYGSGDLHLGRLFQNRRFDFAMTAFLSCLAQIGDFAEAQDSELRLPFRINRDRIGDASIRLQFSQDGTWTRACKYVLTNAKWILAYSSNIAGATTPAVVQE